MNMFWIVVYDAYFGFVWKAKGGIVLMWNLGLKT
jgi:hypothetical protein